MGLFARVALGIAILGGTALADTFEEFVANAPPGTYSHEVNCTLQHHLDAAEHEMRVAIGARHYRSFSNVIYAEGGTPKLEYGPSGLISFSIWDPPRRIFTVECGDVSGKNICEAKFKLPMEAGVFITDEQRDNIGALVDFAREYPSVMNGSEPVGPSLY
ncbi:MAG: hypothetical protein ACE5FT_00615 [Candidatus Nanoarchaeia archaeon]